MRILAWNVNHRTFPKPIPPTMPAALLSLSPDVVVLTEYVQTEGPYGHAFLCEALRDGGLEHVQMSAKTAAHHDGERSRRPSNRVMVASRGSVEPLEALDQEPAPFAASNHLHVRLPSMDAELMGLRVPSYDKGSYLRAYWEWFEARSATLLERRVIIIGDLNADPDLPRRDVGSRCLHRMREAGRWVIPTPGGEAWSYWPFDRRVAPSRIDHVLISEGFAFIEARYVAESDGHVFAGSSTAAMSDHAALVVDIDSTWRS